MCDKIPFFTFFESFVPPRELGLLLHDACVVGGSMDRAQRTMELELTASAPLPEAAVTALRQLLMDQYDLRQLRLSFRTPQRADDRSDVLMGREIKGKPVSIDGLNPKMGAVVIEGKVFAAECYETRKPGVWRLTFDMTDYRNSVTVTKYMEGKEAQSMQNAVSPGMWLRVQGNVELSRDGKDIQLRPFHIMKIPHKPREDTAPEKRVELHLHTKMSNMDALTDTASVIRQAISWGHPAIAITDHGVAQSFPDAWHTAKGKIKILYGVEGYFINNLDDRIAVHGPQDQDFSDEIVCFDIETTGLKVDREAITEIGAVVLKNGQVTDRFQTFVNPGRRLTPEIIGLTGITDAMLSGAPSPKEALTDFLSFVNGRPLAAHNAEFDISFIRAGCRREGIPFDPTYVDSLILAQNLLPQLHKFKLDIVAEYLDLPAFNHHRASDDAAMVAYMLIPFFEKLERELGIRRLQDINPQMLKLRPQGSKSSRFPKHIIILAKNKMGLKHLYQLISASNLQYFKRVPIIPKTELMAHREGLIIGSACEAGELFQAVKDHKDWAELTRIAWFKVHQPLAFYATFFTVRAKAFDAEYCCAGIDAVKRKIREIENNKDATAVEQSLMVTLEVCYEFYLRGFHFDTISIYDSQATAFKITENGLLPPFVSVRGLGETAALDTVEKRKGKTFISVEEFAACCSKLSKTHIEQLKALGAFAGMADTSQITFF